MGAVDFILALHNHQPVGNFDHVIEDAYQRAYRPFLETLERHPRVRWCLHQPGILWEWMESHHPEYLESVRRMVEREQLELVSGGYYEPILPVIPEADRQGQIRKLNHYLETRFGAHPRGGWLAERVWEPHLAQSLARAKLEYSIVDDSHFKSAGLQEHELDNYFITEENGHLLRLFPIAQKLRYSMPFEDPEVTIGFLQALAGEGEPPLWVHADDGEKFGIWPGTHELCYHRGWLERFLTLLEENASWLRTTTFSERIDRVAPRARTYLPTASYAEMMEWALPAAAQRKLHAAVQRVEAGENGTELRIFVRGGFWRNFLARYPESNWMHKKMLYVSRKREALAATDPDQQDQATQSNRAKQLETAAEALWSGQCNCAYWHGLFGGLYLPHLRSAIYHQLIRAEVALERNSDDAAATEVLDFDADGKPEVLLRSTSLLAVVKPSEGGSLFELDDRGRAFNVLDLMSRREEAYHDKLRQLAEGGDGRQTTAATVSIHDLVATKEPGMEQALFYDCYRRGSFIDHVLKPEARFQDFPAARLPELAAFAGCPYTWRLEDGSLILDRVASVQGGESESRLRVVKRIQLVEDAVDVHYSLSLVEGAATEVLFGVEMAANLLAGNAPDRYYEVEGRRLDPPQLSSQGRLADVQRVDLVDEWLGLRVQLGSEVPSEVWRMPIETISMSESGFERVYQGSAVMFLTPVRLEPGRTWTRRYQQRITGA